jgi:hypothetical protein
MARTLPVTDAEFTRADAGMVSVVSEPSTSRPTPLTLRWAILLLAAQAVAVAVLAGVLVYEDITAEAGNRATAWTLTGTAVAVAALLAVLARALSRRRAWARGPAVVLELMLLPIGYYMIQGGLTWVGVPVLVLGLVGAGLLVAPATREVLGVH